VKYKFSNTEYAIKNLKGKEIVYAKCDGCGKLFRNNYGLELSYATRGEWGQTRRKLCAKCMKPYMVSINHIVWGREVQG